MNRLLSVMLWLSAAARDALLWPRNLLRDLPARVARLGQALGAMRYPPGAERLFRRRLAARMHRIVVALFDLVGGPEIAQFFLRRAVQTSPLRPEERAAIASVLGPEAIRYDQVRVAEAGVLRQVFARNGNRAFCAWHTICLPPGKRQDLSLLVHEATHVFQHETIGTRYIFEALYEQWRQGAACYRYGGAPGLRACAEQGRHYDSFNREAQAQIAQDFFRLQKQGHLQEQGAALTVYRPFIEELRAARF